MIGSEQGTMHPGVQVQPSDNWQWTLQVRSDGGIPPQESTVSFTPSTTPLATDARTRGARLSTRDELTR